METLVDLLESLRRHGDRRLFAGNGESLTYADAWDAAMRLSGSLGERGLSAGDGVLITLSNAPAFPIALLGVAAAGCTAILADRDAERIVAGSADGPPKAHIHDGLGEACIGFAGASTPLALRALLAEARRPRHLPVVAASDPATVMYTSGSSGTMRGIVKTHANLAIEVADLAGILARPGARFLSVLPWTYIYGLLHHLLVPMYVGGTALHMRNYTASDLLASVTRDEIDVFVGVPALYRVMSALRLPARMRRPSWAVSSGAPLDRATAAGVGERLGWRLVEFYGSTETGGISFNPDKRDDGDSVGLLMPHAEIGGGLATGSPEIVAVRGPTVSRWAYEANRRVRLTDENGWYATNDVGWLDTRGRLHLLGRTSRLIKVAGRRVSLDAIEAALLTIPGVVDAFAGARPDRVHGEVAVAEVVLAPGSTLTAKDLLEECRLRMPAPQWPRTIRLRDRIDRSASRKHPQIATSGPEPARVP